MKSKLMMFLALFVFAVGVAQAQTRKVTGKVIDEDGLPVIGAMVVVDGTSVGATTNTDGVYTINNVPDGSKVLRISCVGMETRKVAIKDGQTIMLESNSVLNEVMVVAYGTQKRATFTGSATVVGADDIAKVQVTSAIDALKGKAAGVQINNATGQPGYDAAIVIRGFNSLNAGNSPLIVLDGAPFSGSMSDINPGDVESMSVLKDAAATALYGARGGNGVILVTTKNGKRGQKPVITFDAKWGTNQKATPEYEVINSPAGYYEMWYTGLKNYAMYTNGATESAAHIWANQNLIDDPNSQFGLAYNVYTVPEGQYMIGTNGKLNPNATLGAYITGRDGNQYYLTPDNWIDETYYKGLRQEYSFSAQGASDKGTFYMSANYLKNEGITYASGYERFNARLKADFNLTKWMKVSGNMNYSHYDQDALGDDGSAGNSGNAFAFSNMAPIYPMYIRDAEGNIVMHQASGLPRYDYGQGTDILGLTRPFLSQSNPISANRLNINNTNGNTFNGVLSADVYLPYGFTFTSLNTINLRDSRGTSTSNRYFGQYANLNGQNSVAQSRNMDQTYQQRLNWHKLYGKNDIEVMAAHEYYRSRYNYLSGYKNNSFDDRNPELNSAIIVGSTSSYSTLYNTESWLARAMYSYDDRYFGSVNYVHQASSRFHPDHRWGNFWALGAGWMINKESFLKNVNWINELKFKLSYGENGNDRIDGYLYTNRYGIENSDDKIALVPSSAMKNPEVSWEKNAKFNVGFDFAFFKNRLSGSIEYYNNRTNDMLSWITLPASTGYTGFWDNVGNVSNRGLEVSLNGDVIRTKDFTWSLYANLTTNHNEITKLYKRLKTVESHGVWGYDSGGMFYGEGKSLFTQYSRKYAGVNEEGLALYYKDVYETDAQTGEIITDAKGNKVIKETVTTTNYSEATDYLLGDRLPDVYGGFGTSVEWKGLDFSVDFQYQLGGLVYDGSYASLMDLSRGRGIHVDMLNAWTPEHHTDIPRAAFKDSYMASTSDRFLTSASYLNLANVTLGYTLAMPAMKQIGLQKVRLYVVADNIWTWTKRQGLDPRQDPTGSNTNTYYKPIRTISGGITVTF